MSTAEAFTQACSRHGAEAGNPYWEEVLALRPDFLALDPDESDASQLARADLMQLSCLPCVSAIRSLRRTLIWQYSWAIPDPAALDFLMRHMPSAGVVEIGAGTGYWAWQLAFRGVAVRAFDCCPPDQLVNRFHTPLLTDSNGQVIGHHPVLRQTFYPVEQGDENKASAFPERALLLCAPSRSEPMAAAALASYRGRTVFYIGEEHGGAHADSDFHERLASDWRLMTARPLARFLGCYERVCVYIRAGSED